MIEKNIIDDAILEVFLQDTLDKAGFDAENDDMDLLKDELKPLVMDTLITKIYEALGDVKMQEVQTLVEQDQGEAALEYIQNNIAEYDTFVADVLQQFQDNYISYMKESLE